MFHPRPFVFQPRRRPSIRCRLKGQNLPDLVHGALVSDRVLYRPDGEPVTLFLYQPRPDQRVLGLELYYQQSLLQTHRLTLDEFGTASLQLDGLPEGEFVARCGTLQCPFRVARNTQTPLLAELENMRQVGRLLEFDVLVSCFGQPVQGGVQVDLMHGFSCDQSLEVQAREGRFQVRFQPSAWEAYRLELRLIEDGECTAELPLPGTSHQEITPSLMANFEPPLLASSVAQAGSQPRRGLHFMAGAAGHGFLQLQPDHLLALRDLEEVLVVVGPAWKQLRHRRVRAGQRIDFPAPALPTWLLAGALDAHGQSWEGLAALVPTNAHRPEIHFESGRLTCRGGPSRGRAWVVVKDARASHYQTVGSVVAEQLKVQVEEVMGEWNRPAPPGRWEVWRERWREWLEARRHFGQEDTYSGSIRLDLVAGPVSPSAFSSPGKPELAFPSPPPDDHANYHFAALLALADGQAELDLRLEPGDYLAQVTLIGEGDWGEAEHRFRHTRSPWLEWRLPAWAGSAPGSVRALAGQGRLRLSCGSAILLECELQEGQELSFDCPPGPYEAVFEQADGSRHCLRGELVYPGWIDSFCRSFSWLQPGQALEAGDDELQLVPEPKVLHRQVARGLAYYPYDCCEQTAAKMVAGLELVLDGDSARGDQLLLEGVERLESRWQSGSGFLGYLGGGPAGGWWGRATLGHLQLLSALPENHPHRPRIMTLLERASLDYPDEEGGAGDLEQAFRRRDLEYARRHGLPQVGAVERRRQAAYGAALLLRYGEAQDRLRAAEWVGQAMTELGGHDRLYSTLDTVAVLLLLSELRKHQRGARVRLDGVEMGWEQALQQTSLRTVEVLEGSLLVQRGYRRRENWHELPATCEIRGQLPGQARVGQRCGLELELPNGYQPGDLVWIALSQSLTQQHAGAQVRWFCQDLAGSSRVSVPLWAVGPGAASARVVLRNMYEEERASQLLVLEMEVQAAAEVGSRRARADFGDSHHRQRREIALGLGAELVLDSLLLRLDSGNQPLLLVDNRWSLGEQHWTLEQEVRDRLLLEADLFPDQPGLGLVHWGARLYLCGCLSSEAGPLLSLRPVAGDFSLPEPEFLRVEDEVWLLPGVPIPPGVSVVPVDLEVTPVRLLEDLSVHALLEQKPRALLVGGQVNRWLAWADRIHLYVESLP